MKNFLLFTFVSLFLFGCEQQGVVDIDNCVETIKLKEGALKSYFGTFTCMLDKTSKEGVHRGGICAKIETNKQNQCRKAYIYEKSPSIECPTDSELNSLGECACLNPQYVFDSQSNKCQKKTCSGDFELNTSGECICPDNFIYEKEKKDCYSPHSYIKKSFDEDTKKINPNKRHFLFGDWKVSKIEEIGSSYSGYENKIDVKNGDVITFTESSIAKDGVPLCAYNSVNSSYGDYNLLNNQTKESIWEYEYCGTIGCFTPSSSSIVNDYETFSVLKNESLCAWNEFSEILIFDNNTIGVDLYDNLYVLERIQKVIENDAFKSLSQIEVMGVDDMIGFIHFWEQFQKAIKEKDADFLFNILPVENSELSINSKEDISKRFEEFFPKEIQEQILNPKFEDFFISWRGLYLDNEDVALYIIPYTENEQEQYKIGKLIPKD